MTSPSGRQPVRLVGSDRVLSVLTLLASYPTGATLDELFRASGQPKASMHRALAALQRAGFARKSARGRYVLGDNFLRLAFAHHEARPEHLRANPLLQRLVERFHETAHFAVLDGVDVVYRAKVDPPSGAVRLSSTVGGRNPAHSTGVGMLLLSYELHDRHDVDEWLGGRTLERRTPNTITTAVELADRLARIRESGYALDDQENEAGVNCIALPAFFASPSVPSGAISVSALAHRTPLSKLVCAAAEIRAMIEQAAGTETGAE